jgi:hypothetical protein
VQDHVREKPANCNLKSLTLKEFTGLIFEQVWQARLGTLAASPAQLPQAGSTPRDMLVFAAGTWPAALQGQPGEDL